MLMLFFASDIVVSRDIPKRKNIELSGGYKLLNPLPPPSAKIITYAWLDYNENGIKDFNDGDLKGVSVRLYNSNDNLIASGVTGNNGYYTFENVPNGTYRVRYSTFTGLNYTYKDQGTDDNLDSDLDYGGYSAYMTVSNSNENYIVTGGFRGNLQVFMGNSLNICQGSSVTLKAETFFGKAPFTYDWNQNLPHQESVVVSPTATTEFHVTVTDAWGFKADGYIIVRVKNGIGEERYTVIDDFNHGTEPNSLRLVVSPLNPGPIHKTDYANTGIIGGSREVMLEYISGTRPASVEVDYNSGFYSNSNEDGAISYNELHYNNGGNGLHKDISGFDYIKINDIGIDQGEVILSIKITDFNNNSADITKKLPGLGNFIIFNKELRLSEFNNIASLDLTDVKEICFKFSSFDKSIDYRMGDIWICEFTDCQVKVEPVAAELCQGDSVDISASAGCVNIVNYEWDNGVGAGAKHRIAPDVTTVYHVTATDAYGCTSTDSVKVIVNNKPTIKLPSNLGVCKGDTLEIEVEHLTGLAPYKYIWSTGDTTKIIKVSPTSNSVYSVTVYDANNCSSETQDVSVEVYPTPSVVLSSTIADCAESNGSATAVANGGTPPYSYKWSNGVTTDNNSAIPAGDYTLTVTDANGCTVVDKVVVAEKDCGLLGNFVWEDDNYNGVQDQGEKGIENVKVELFDKNKNLLDMTLTDNNGIYYFYSLHQGEYYVKFTKPDNYYPTKRRVGLGNSDSDADLSTGFTELISLDKYEKDSTIDAGFYRLASIGDTVWVDKDGDGIQDTDEPGLGGVEVKLLDCDDNEINTTTTDQSGKYIFEDLIPGDYKVQFVLPAGYKFTDSNSGTDANADSDADELTGKADCESLTSGENNMTYDAGVYVPASIGDIVWLDKNANGVQDQGEPGISGVSVILNDCSGNPIDTVLTDADGKYLFDKLTPGDYKISFIMPAGYQLSEANSGDDSADSDIESNGYSTCESLESGENNLTYDIGLYEFASIGDYVWLDTNGDGIQNPHESGIEGVTVELQDCSGAVISTMETDDSGKYLFDNLRPGDYRIKFNLPASYHFTEKDKANDAADSDANNSGITVCEELESGEENLTYDAGVYRYAEIGDKVWLDEDGDGVQDPGELGKENVKVELWDCSGNLLETQYTDPSGNYLFDNLVPGQYKLKFYAPTDYSFTKKDNTVDVSDSDADKISGETACEDLLSDEKNHDYDAGLYTRASIGDTVWVDKDGDGIQDADEPGLGDVEVKLLDCDDNEINTTTTDQSGKYIFEDLIPGDYKVQFVLPAGYKFTDSNSGTDANADSDADELTGKADCESLTSGENNMTYDAGVYVPASIGDIVWLDKNANGVQDQGEPGISGVSVILNDCSGNPIDTVLTDADGKYLFDKLTPGDYKISFIMPAGYQLSEANSGDDSADSDIESNGYSTCESLESGENNLTYDIGLYEFASIGDYVWLDTNGDGIQNPHESGIEGVTVELQDCSGAVISTMETDDSGKYLFDNLRPGDYRIKFNLPASYHFTEKDKANDAADSDANNSGITVCEELESGEENLTYDAGVYRYAEIGDKVWLDEDGDGVQDPGELGKENVKVELWDCSGNLLETQYTDPSGNYLFDNLVPGQYKLKFYAPTDYSFTKKDNTDDGLDSDVDATTGKTDCEILESDERNHDYDAGLVYFASLGDYVWEDMNGDGVQQVDEPAISGVEIRLYKWNAGSFVYQSSQYTDTQGKYLFDELTAGSYYIKVVPPAGYDLTFANKGADDSVDCDIDNTNGSNTSKVISLSPGEEDLTWDIGLYQCASIGDLIWSDYIQNNVYDSEEGGIDGVLVKLWRKEGSSYIYYDNTYSSYKPSSTCGSGYWSFCVAPGEYYVEFTGMNGTDFIHVAPNTGNDDNVDSDVDDTHGQNTTANYTLYSGDSITHVFAGFYKEYSIFGKAWIDINEDGIRTDDEDVFGSIEVELYNELGYIASEYTDLNGDYSFGALDPGNYYIKFELPADYYFTAPDQGGDDNYDSDVTGNNGNNTTNWFSIEDGENIDAGYVPTTGANGFSVFPNPSTNKVKIDFLGKKDENISLYIMNPNGEIYFKDEKLRSEENKILHKEVDIERIPSGVYQVFIKSDNKLYRSKFLKIGK